MFKAFVALCTTAVYASPQSPPDGILISRDSLPVVTRPKFEATVLNTAQPGELYHIQINNMLDDKNTLRSFYKFFYSDLETLHYILGTMAYYNEANLFPPKVVIDASGLLENRRERLTLWLNHILNDYGEVNPAILCATIEFLGSHEPNQNFGRRFMRGWRRGSKFGGKVGATLGFFSPNPLVSMPVVGCTFGSFSGLFEGTLNGVFGWKRSTDMVGPRQIMIRTPTSDGDSKSLMAEAVAVDTNGNGDGMTKTEVVGGTVVDLPTATLAVMATPVDTTSPPGYDASQQQVQSAASAPPNQDAGDFGEFEMPALPGGNADAEPLIDLGPPPTHPPPVPPRNGAQPGYPGYNSGGRIGDAAPAQQADFSPRFPPSRTPPGGTKKDN